jgi:hypothetical protein
MSDRILAGEGLAGGKAEGRISIYDINPEKERQLLRTLEIEMKSPESQKHREKPRLRFLSVSL